MSSYTHFCRLLTLALSIVLFFSGSFAQANVEETHVLTAEQLIQIYMPASSSAGLARDMNIDRGIAGVRQGKTTTLASRKSGTPVAANPRQGFQNILFGVNSINIKGESYRQLDEIGKALNVVMGHHPEARFVVEGHTDSMGAEYKNETLSYNRANAVKKYLVGRFDIDEQRISVMGYGERKPLAANDSAHGRKLNRRVEIVGQQ